MAYQLYTERPELTAPRVHWFNGDIAALRVFLAEIGKQEMVVTQDVTEKGMGRFSLMVRGRSKGYFLDDGVAVVHFPPGHPRFDDIVKVIPADRWNAEYEPLETR